MIPPPLHKGLGKVKPNPLGVQYDAPTCHPPQKWIPPKTFRPTMIDSIGMYSSSATMMQPCNDIADATMTPLLGSVKFDATARPPSQYNKALFNPHKRFGALY